jgi:hypothetical protein
MRMQNSFTNFDHATFSSESIAFLEENFRIFLRLKKVGFPEKDARNMAGLAEDKRFQQAAALALEKHLL